MSLIRLACSVLLATMVASTAWAEAVTEADWAEKPTPERVGGAYPKMAQMLAIEGTAILSCKVTAGGILENCAASAEAPREFGFAAAALSLTPYFRMRPEIRDGRAALSEVRIPLHFILPEPQPLAQTGRPTSAQAQALARDFVRLDHRADQLRELYRAKSQLLEFIRTPGAPPDVRQAAGAATRAALEGRMEEILDAMASVYAAKFTERELKDIVRATREKDPPVFLVQRADLTEVEKNLMSEFNRRLQVSARAAFCERQACTPDRDFGLPRAGQGGPEVTIPAPIWLERPTVEQIATARPPLANAFGIEGRVQLACTVGPLGIVDTCDITEESPNGLGFGAAAQSLRGYFRLSPAVMQRGVGDVADVQVRFPAPFNHKEAMQDPAAAPPQKIELVRAYLNAVRGDAVRDDEIGRALAAFDSMKLEGLDAAARATAREVIRSAAVRTWGEMSDLVARSYASALTESELHHALQFTETPGGKVS